MVRSAALCRTIFSCLKRPARPLINRYIEEFTLCRVGDVVSEIIENEARRNFLPNMSVKPSSYIENT